MVVGKIGDDLRMDYTAVGDTTNLAARLQQLAEGDGDYQRQRTWLVRPFRDVRPGEHAVKG